MPLATFAALVGATPKWCQNALQVLGRPFRYDLPTAEALALTHQLNHTLEIPLPAAWLLAMGTLTGAAGVSGGVVSLRIDLHRFREEWMLRRLRVLATPPRLRGRPRDPIPPRSSRADAVARAERYGLDLGALRAGLRIDPAHRLQTLDASQRLIAALRR